VVLLFCNCIISLGTVVLGDEVNLFVLLLGFVLAFGVLFELLWAYSHNFIGVLFAQIGAIHFTARSGTVNLLNRIDSSLKPIEELSNPLLGILT